MKNEKMRNIIVQGWRAMLLILMTMTSVFILQGTMEGKLQAWAQKGGVAELWGSIIFFGFAAVMPFLVGMWEAKAFRWIVFAITLLWTLLFVVFLILSLSEALGPYYPVLYIVHDIVAIWTTVIAYKWARLKEE